MEINTEMSIYEINKNFYKDAKPYDPIALNLICNKTAENIWHTFSQGNYSYWMLLCRERNDYTIFRLEDSVSNFSSALVECLNNRGRVLDITKQEDGNYEIWIRDFDTNENVVYYLFDYQNGIVEV